jgi:hypothetical protein
MSVANLTNVDCALTIYPNSLVTQNLQLAKLPGAGDVLTSDAFGNASWAPASSSPNSQISFPISSAQILAMPDFAPQVLPAPGAGKAYIVNNVVLNYVFGGIAYTVPPGTNLLLEQGGFNLITPIDAGLLADGANQIQQQSGGILNQASSLVINFPMNVNLSGAVTAGNGNLTLIVNYSILTVQ